MLISDPMGKVDLIDPTDGSVRDKVLDGIFKMRLAEFNKYFSHLTAQN